MVALKLRFRPRGSRILPCLKWGDVSVKGVELSNIWLLSGMAGETRLSGEEAGKMGTLLGFRRLDFDVGDSGDIS